jgi:hypothetical protein
MQEQKLFKHEKQKEHNRKDTDKKILQTLQKAYSTQGDKVVGQ